MRRVMMMHEVMMFMLHTVAMIHKKYDTYYVFLFLIVFLFSDLFVSVTIIHAKSQHACK